MESAVTRLVPDGGEPIIQQTGEIKKENDVSNYNDATWLNIYAISGRALLSNVVVVSSTTYSS